MKGWAVGCFGGEGNAPISRKRSERKEGEYREMLKPQLDSQVQEHRRKPNLISESWKHEL